MKLFYKCHQMKFLLKINSIITHVPKREMILFMHHIAVHIKSKANQQNRGLKKF